MKLPLRSLFFAVLFTTPTAFLTAGEVLNGADVCTVPDGGSSIVLLAVGITGLAIAARKRFKRG